MSLGAMSLGVVSLFLSLVASCNIELESTEDGELSLSGERTEARAGEQHEARTAALAVSAPSPCPTSGDGAIVTSARCFVFPPTATGVPSGGLNAGVNHYALAPLSGGSGKLVLFLNPSLGSPAFSIASPSNNLYTAAVAAGDHVLGLSHASDQIIGGLCNGNDGCFYPTRATIVTGVRHAGAAARLRQIALTDSVYGRAALALAYLAASRPADGWGQYLVPGVDPLSDPARAVQWSKVIAMGHSQGGGHAAVLAKLQPLARLVTLSSPCDEVDGVPSSWLTADASWRAQPSALGYGFASSSDSTCHAHGAIWSALGLAAARRFDDAATCSGASAHTATTQCTANMARVQSLVTM